MHLSMKKYKIESPDDVYRVSKALCSHCVYYTKYNGLGIQDARYCTYKRNETEYIKRGGNCYNIRTSDHDHKGVLKLNAKSKFIHLCVNHRLIEISTL